MITALSLGLAVGILLGLVGAGGSIIAVPALVYGVGMSTGEAIPTSLLVVGMASMTALLPRLRAGINWPVVGLVGVAGIPAAWGGAAVGTMMNPDLLMLFFAVIMVVAGIRMLGSVTETAGSCSTGPHRSFRACAPKALAVGVLIGFLTGLLGVGGGFLLTPALTLFLGLGLKQAAGSSLAIIAINSAAGFSAHAVGFTIDWSLALAFALPAILGSLIASRFAGLLPERLLKVAFAILIFTVAAWVVATTAVALLISP